MYTYYVQFEGGSAQWSGSLDTYLKGFLQDSGTVTSLALGPDNSFYCRNNSGRELYQNLPKGLKDALVGRKNSLPVVNNVNLGPN